MTAGNYEGLGKGRTVPLEVLVVGLPRTGTTSMMMALEELGYVETFHMPKGLVGGSDESALWIKAMDAKFAGKGKPFEKEDWDVLLGRYMATADAPATFFGEELMSAYPDAKVIISTRDTALQWAESMDAVGSGVALIVYDRGSFMSNLWRRISPVTPQIAVMNKVIKYTRIGHLGSGQVAQDFYHEHNDRMRRYCYEHGREYLEFNVKQGWGPLCRYLKKDIPNTEFPRSNDREIVKGRLSELMAAMDHGARWNLLKYISAFGMLGLAILLGKRTDTSFWTKLIRR